MSDPAAFIPHILKPNPAALEALITKPEVERKLLARLQKKAATYAQDFGPDGESMVSTEGGRMNGSGKIDVDGVVDLYESYIIPLTKEVEVSDSAFLALSRTTDSTQVEYLLHRLDGLSQEEIDQLMAK